MKRERIDIARFSDGRLKVLRIHNKDDSNVRINGNEISICSRNRFTNLERDTLEAINLWNLMLLHPKLREAINEILQSHCNITLESLFV